MSHRALMLAALLVAGCSPLAEERAANSDDSSEVAAPTYRAPQACDAVATDRDAGTTHGFLFVGKPHLMLSEDIRRLANLSYPRQVETAYLLYVQSNTLRQDADAAFQRQDERGLAQAFQLAIELARKGLRLNSEVLVEGYGQAGLPNPSDHLEMHLIEQAYEIVYLSSVLNPDYRLLARRDAAILALDWSPEVKRLFRSGAVEDVADRAPIAPNAVRGAILSRLIAGDRQAAERFVVFGMRDQGGRDHYPLSHADLLRAEADGSPLDGLTFSTGNKWDVGRRCSDLFAAYVEWLDLRSRVARSSGDVAEKRAISDRLHALKGVPPELVGERYGSAIGAIETRVSHMGRN